MTARRILLADADAFYVSVARLVDPEGAGRHPLLIVGGSADQRGVVTSASYEARAYGVSSAMPMARAARLCPDAMIVPVPWEACVEKGEEILPCWNGSRRPWSAPARTSSTSTCRGRSGSTRMSTS